MVSISDDEVGVCVRSRSDMGGDDERGEREESLAEQKGAREMLAIWGSWRCCCCCCA